VEVGEYVPGWQAPEIDLKILVRSVTMLTKTGPQSSRSSWPRETAVTCPLKVTRSERQAWSSTEMSAATFCLLNLDGNE
jgi:hypothetical protein